MVEKGVTKPSDILGWVNAHQVVTLNVAGNRESKNAGLGQQVETFLARVFASTGGDPDLGRLRDEAERVRRAIEETPRGEESGNLRDFPARCCHHATNILALHLSGLGYSDLVNARGERRRGTEARWHVWLEHRGVIVDITADQFGRRWLAPVIVARRSRWHAAWMPERTPIGESSLTNWSESDHAIHRAYRSVLATLRGDRS